VIPLEKQFELGDLVSIGGMEAIGSTDGVKSSLYATLHG